MRSVAVCLLVCCLGICSQAGGQVGVIPGPAGPELQSPGTSPAPKAQLVENYGKLPLSFEANMGQVDKSVKFLSRGSGWVTGTAALTVQPTPESNGCIPPRVRQRRKEEMEIIREH